MLPFLGADTRSADAPVTPRTVETPTLPIVGTGTTAGSQSTSDDAPTVAGVVSDITPLKASEVTAAKDCQRILRDIDAASLMQEELAKITPAFVASSSFIGTVCGYGRTTKKVEKSREFDSILRF